MNVQWGKLEVGIDDQTIQIPTVKITEEGKLQTQVDGHDVEVLVETMPGHYYITSVTVIIDGQEVTETIGEGASLILRVLQYDDPVCAVCGALPAAILPDGTGVCRQHYDASKHEGAVCSWYEKMAYSPYPSEELVQDIIREAVFQIEDGPGADEFEDQLLDMKEEVSEIVYNWWQDLEYNPMEIIEVIEHGMPEHPQIVVRGIPEGDAHISYVGIPSFYSGDFGIDYPFYVVIDLPYPPEWALLE